MFEFLFKYPAEYFAEGKLITALPWWQLILLPLGIAILAFVALGYFRLEGRIRSRDRMAISLLRGLALGLIIFSLSRPLLEVTTQMQQPGVVGVLLDNSISMGLKGPNRTARSDFIRQQFDAESGDLLRDLQQDFDVRLFKFGAETKAISDIDALDFNDGDSDLTRALSFTQASLRGEPLAGLVVVSDGALQPDEPLDALLLSLKSSGIPVFSVGLGERRYARDIAISRIRLPGAVFERQPGDGGCCHKTAGLRRPAGGTLDRRRQPDPAPSADTAKTWHAVDSDSARDRRIRSAPARVSPDHHGR